MENTEQKQDFSHEVDTLVEFLSFPLDSTDEIFEKFKTLPGAVVNGSGKNKFCYIKGHRENKVVLVAHADTVWNKGYARTVAKGTAGHFKVDGGKIVSTHPTAGLGADDRAGLAILWLLKGLGHSLLILDGEEIGCHGAKAAFTAIGKDLNDDHQFAVEFDRMGAHDFKCYYVGSDEFRAYVAEQTGYTEPNRSSYSDICWISDPMCGVNLSVGYYHEHTKQEHLVISEWLNTLHVAKKWLSATELPRFERDKADVKPVKTSWGINTHVSTSNTQNKIYSAEKKKQTYGSNVVSKIAGVVETGKFTRVTKIAEITKFYNDLGYLDADKSDNEIVSKNIGLSANKVEDILNIIFLDILTDFISIQDFYSFAVTKYKSVDLTRKLKTNPLALDSNISSLLYIPGVQYYKMYSDEDYGTFYLVMPSTNKKEMFIMVAK